MTSSHFSFPCIEATNVRIDADFQTQITEILHHHVEDMKSAWLAFAETRKADIDTQIGGHMRPTVRRSLDRSPTFDSDPITQSTNHLLSRPYFRESSGCREGKLKGERESMFQRSSMDSKDPTLGKLARSGARSMSFDDAEIEMLSRRRSNTWLGSRRNSGCNIALITQPNLWKDAFLDAYRSSWMNFAKLRASTFNVSCVLKSKPLQSRACQQRLNYFVNSTPFCFFSAFCMLANAILIGMETEHLTWHRETLPGYVVTQQALNIWYIVELLIQMAGQGRGFWQSNERRWNAMDLILVSTSVVEMTIEAVHHESMKMGRVLRCIRLCRVLRTLRVLRNLRSIRTFRKMIFALAASLQTMFWSLTLLLIVIYVFAVWVTSGVSDCLWGRMECYEVHDQTRHDLIRNYGSLSKSTLSLYEAVSTGMNWDIFLRPLMDVDWLLVALFLTFISVSFFGVLNIVTAVFVESAMLSTQRYQELLVEEKLRTKELYYGHIKNIFLKIDKQGTGTLSLDDFTKYLLDGTCQLQSYFEALGVHADDAGTLFKLLDVDGSGKIEIDEFCEGCLRLAGEARSFDLNCLMYDIRNIWTAQKRFEKLFIQICQVLEFEKAGDADVSERDDSEGRPAAEEETMMDASV